jgi:hypothetical protein
MIFTEQKSINLYNTILGQTPKGQADALVKVGGESLTKFVPNINASKWNDECWLNINNKAVSVVGEKQTFVDGKVDLIVGNDLHRFYITPEGKQEYEIWFSSQPEKPELLFDLQFAKGLDFFYQPFLLDEHRTSIDEVLERNPEIEGSYAIYWNKKNNIYQTGKVGHINRPKLIDAKGNVSWCKLFIDPVSSVLQVLMDEEWLKKAIYPVHPDLLTIGFSSDGGSTATLSANQLQAFRYASGGAGDANPGTFYIYCLNNAADDVTMLGAAYNSSGSSVSGQDRKSNTISITVTTQNVTAWLSSAITWTGILAATDYFLAIIESGTSFQYRYDTTTGYVDMEYKAQTYADLAGVMPDPFPTSPSAFGRNCSMYVEYTAAASGLSILTLYSGMDGNSIDGNCNLMG